MNLYNPRGIENRLLRRVRRHQSMSALFRKQVSHSERPRRPWTPAVVQAKLQDAPIDDAQESEAVFPVPELPVTSPLEAKQVPVPVEPPFRPERPQASASSSIPAPRSQESNTPDPVWKRLQTIFRKHQEPGGEETNSAPADEGAVPPPVQSHADEEQRSEPEQASKAGGQAFPTRNQTVPAPASIPVQHQPDVQPDENKPGTAAITSTSMPKTQLQGDEARDRKAKAETDEPPSALSPAMEKQDVSDPLPPADRYSKQPPLQLHSAWKIQRMESSNPPHQEASDRTTGESQSSQDDKLSEQTIPSGLAHASIKPGPLASMRETDHADELEAPAPLPATPIPVTDPAPESSKLVEVLAPSRPRPVQTSLPQTSANLQREYQAPQTEAKPAETASINTVIGPLPADLWWLLGQEPPSETTGVQTNDESDPGPERHASHQEPNSAPPMHATSETPANATSSSPDTIQRQVVTDHPLPRPPSYPEQTSSSHSEKTRPAEPDLDDLARRVYTEVRRRLATEWERMR